MVWDIAKAIIRSCLAFSTDVPLVYTLFIFEGDQAEGNKINGRSLWWR